MAPSSSISSSRLRQVRLVTICAGAAVASVWILYLWCAAPLAEWISASFGERLLAIGRGRITDPAVFVNNRLLEIAYLLMVLAILVVLGACAVLVLERRVSKAWLWLPISLFVFVEINVLVLLASETGIYWMTLHAGHPNLKQTGFHTERILLNDSPAKTKAVVLGSSQAQSQIHTGELIRDFYPEVHVANMGYAGAQAFDFLLIRDHYQESSPDAVICYLSEQSLYTPASAARYLPLLKLRGLDDVAQLGAWRLRSKGRLVHGGAAMLLPLFRSRRAVNIFLFGEDIAVKAPRPPKSGKAVAASEPEDPVRRKAAEYQVGPGSDFQKRSLERFIRQNLEVGTKVILIAGQVNPILAERISPDVQDDFPRYLRDLGRKYPDLIVLSDELPSHGADEYDDSMHITPKVRLRYTARLADVLEQKLGWHKHADTRISRRD